MSYWRDMASVSLDTSLAVLGEDVQVHFQSPAETVTVQGRFREQFKSGEAGYESRGQHGLTLNRDTPWVTVHRADLPREVVRGDQVTVGGKTYEVTEVRQDREQGRLLMLREVLP